MELRIVRQSGTPTLGTTTTPPVTDIDVNSSANCVAGDVLRFELQFRIIDTNTADAIIPDGLTSASVNITSGGGTLDRAILSRREHSLAGINGPLPTDSTGQGSVAQGAGRTGLHNPYRGGLTDTNDNDLPSNGIVLVDSNPDPAHFHPGAGNTLLSITPLSLAASHQGNENLDDGDDTNGTTNELTWYGLYSFTYTCGAANDTINANNVADAQTGSAFGFWVEGSGIPITSVTATGASYRIVVPAPGAAALLGLGGLIVARRRRA
jgi:hypothetical protein